MIRTTTESRAIGSPIFESPFPVLLEDLMRQNLLEAATLKNRSQKSPEFGQHMAGIEDTYKNQITKKASAEDPATADEVYDLIKNTWGSVVNKGLSQKEFNEFLAVLDRIRQEWKENPEGPHKIGPHSYGSEKEHVASYPGQWITAGQVGSSRAYDRPAGFGTHEWINGPDSGATASGGPKGAGGDRGKGDEAPEKTGSSGKKVHKSSGRDTGEFHANQQGYMDPASGKFRKYKHLSKPGTQQESWDPSDIGDMIAEEINDTWLTDR